jgi:hypothetical protein
MDTEVDLQEKLLQNSSNFEKPINTEEVDGGVVET